MLYAHPKLYVVSDSAFSVEFGDHIGEDLNRRVNAFAKAIAVSPPPGLVEIVPSYRAVMVEYDPEVTPYDRMADVLQRLAATAGEGAGDVGRTVEIPVLYGGAYGPDLPGVAEETGLSPDEVIAIHTAGSYPVYMMGFTPGFPYLGGMDKRIAAARLTTPRTLIPAGSVGIAGEQTGVYSLPTPGGWRLIGRTPLTLFDRDAPQPFLLAAGDIVKFTAIDEAGYVALGGELLD